MHDSEGDKCTILKVINVQSREYMKLGRGGGEPPDFRPKPMDVPNPSFTCKHLNNFEQSLHAKLKL